MKTSQHQFDLLVTYMEEHGDLSKPTSNARGRMVAIRNWEELTSLLNSDGGGDTKTTEKWKKVWSDFKNNTKKKAARLHRAARGTGGGPAVYAKLSDLEQRVLNLIGVQVATGLAIAEAGLSQENVDVTIVEQTPHEVQHEVDIELFNESGTSTQVPCVPGPSSQLLTGDLRSSQAHLDRRPSSTESRPPSQAHVESPRPTSRTTMDMPPSRPVVSPPFIIFNEEPIENIEELNSDAPALSPQNMVAASVSQPAPSGQTTPRRRVRFSRVRLSPSNRQSPRRRARPQSNHTEQAAQHFLHSDAEWRAFRMQQHRDYLELRREQNRIRELEIQSQKEWQTVGLRMLEILNKVADKFCKD